MFALLTEKPCTVSSLQHTFSRSVVERRRFARHHLVRTKVVGILAVLLACALVRTNAWAAEPPEGETGSSSYWPWQGGAYLVAPFLALGLGAATFELTQNEVLTDVAAGIGFLLPASVHTAHREPERGLVSIGTMVGFSLGGAVAFGGLGLAVARSTDCEDRDCDVTYPLFGALFGLGAGYIANAVYDTVAHTSLPATSTHVEQGKLSPVLPVSWSFWATPILSPGLVVSKAPDAILPAKLGLPVNGIEIGASLSL